MKPDYGLDAPGLVRGFVLGGLAMASLLVLASVALFTGSIWSVVVTAVLLIATVYLIGMGCLMLYWSKVTKIRQRETSLDLVPWRGDEQVLDVGCGRGLMLIGAARRLTTGRAVGIDIWNASDQSANGPQGALENATVEGVADRIAVQTADMRTLPFADRSFDVVVSHWVVHNADREADRDKALSEMMRVLRPGGSLILCDIAHRDAYLARLKGLGLTHERMLFSPAVDLVLAAVSFGSFRPFTLCGRAAT